MPFLVGDRVACNGAKILGNKHAKQRYGRLFNETKLLGGVQRINGKGRSVKRIIYFYEVATLKAFSARSIRRHSTAAGGYAEASIPTAISIAISPQTRRLKNHMSKKAMTSVMAVVYLVMAYNGRQ